MSRPPWFRHDPEHTATGYRWLDLLTDPYFRIRGWWTARKFWKLMRVGNDSIRETKRWVRAYFNASPRPSTDELLRRIEEK